MYNRPKFTLKLLKISVDFENKLRKNPNANSDGFKYLFFMEVKNMKKLSKLMAMLLVCAMFMGVVA